MIFDKFAKNSSAKCFQNEAIAKVNYAKKYILKIFQLLFYWRNWVRLHYVDGVHWAVYLKITLTITTRTNGNSTI